MLATGLLIQFAGGALGAGGNLDHFNVVVSGTSTAGTALSLTVTAIDSLNRTVRNYTNAHCLTFSGPANSPNGTVPSYPDVGACPTGQSQVAFANGVGRPSVTLHNAAATTLTVEDLSIPFSGSSASFTVVAASAASLTFTAQPINTKVGTPIYNTCVPPTPALANPCALTTGTPASSPVNVLAVDKYGNFATDTVTIKRGSTTLGSDVPDGNGVASFGDSVVTGDLGAATLRASTSATVFTDSRVIQIVPDLDACDGNSCKNVVDNGARNVQRAVNTIATGNDFFTAGSTNVLLATTFLDASAFSGQCGGPAIIGQGTEATVAGTGITATEPTTTMLLIIPKKSLLAFGVSSRAADSFNVCVGAIRLDDGSGGWFAKQADGTLALTTSTGGTHWGTAADCSQLPAGSTGDPCAALKTKNVGEVKAYFTRIGDDATAASIPSLMANSDLAIVIRKVYPWDGKTGLY
ncbi:MAG TPA: hypothetical protein VM427_09260 [Patescibacteria group bacterium]|nr:hypothetical protein [Patescibacteria group bacterium]